MTTMRGTRTIGWLQGRFETINDWTKTGHMFARFLLILAQNGVYLQPFGSIITNAKSHERLRTKFQIDEKDDFMWLIMRLGYSKEPPRSLRLETDEIIYN